MEVVKGKTKGKTKNEAPAPVDTSKNPQLPVNTPKPPTFFLLTEQDLTNIMTALADIPYRMSNPIIEYLKAKVKPVNLANNTKTDKDEQQVDPEAPKE